jgi:hypothetical protein
VAVGAPEATAVLDPNTALKTKLQGITPEQRVLRGLMEDQGVAGFLYPDIVGVRAYFVGDEAVWDGVKQKVGRTRSTGAKIVSGIANLLIRGEEDFEDLDPEGSVAALSLVVKVQNSIGAHLFTGRGGIELLEGADFEGGVYIGEKEPEDYEIVEVPNEVLFQKRSRLQRAVRIALEPLLRGG